MFLVMVAMTVQTWAQKTCVIASAEDHLPLREALIHTDNNHWARTDYRGYWNMKYAFDSATVSKHGFLKTTIRYKELPDTVFLLPESYQIKEVTVWGKGQEHIEQMQQQIKRKVLEDPQPITGIGFDALGWMDKRGNRDRKHLKKAKGVFQELDRKDPIVAAYEKVTGRKYGEVDDSADDTSNNDSLLQAPPACPEQNVPDEVKKETVEEVKGNAPEAPDEAKKEATDAPDVSEKRQE